jgi:aryl-alcohol dehydrogenase-like predicted oxidoreductase
MIGLEDCIAMCGLEPDEVAAICEHEHIGAVPASALASYLLHQAHGSERIRTMIIEDIHEALDRGEVKHAVELLAVLRHFLQHHPDAAVGMVVE